MVRIQDIISAPAIAAYATEDIQGRAPYMGLAFFPNRKLMSFDIKWLRTHKGLNAALMPSNFDAIPTVRSREGFKVQNAEMAFYRESMPVDERNMMELSRAANADDPYLQSAITSMYEDPVRLIEAAEIAAEAMRMQLLATDNGTPKISIGTGDNTVYTYTFDPDGSYKREHYLKLTGDSTWDKRQAG